MMNLSKLLAPILIAQFLIGCAPVQPDRYVDTSAWGANYTEDYIYEYWIQTASGKSTGVGGVQLSEFSRGGTGGSICCSLMPGVGSTVKVGWRTGGRQEDRSQWKAYSREVVVSGSTSNEPHTRNLLIVRFFSGNQVEAEFAFESTRPDGKPNPRVDQLFYGRRTMRQMGE